ncbi:MAG: hypothetical protein HY719_13770 [Planctomycetes bacterium]|nr:hypothetical protein [Planctomycetota bacterium]
MPAEEFTEAEAAQAGEVLGAWRWDRYRWLDVISTRRRAGWPMNLHVLRDFLEASRKQIARDPRPDADTTARERNYTFRLLTREATVRETKEREERERRDADRRAMDALRASARSFAAGALLHLKCSHGLYVVESRGDGYAVCVEVVDGITANLAAMFDLAEVLRKGGEIRPAT